MQRLLPRLYRYRLSGLAWIILLSWLGVLGVWLFEYVALSEIAVVLTLAGVFVASALVYLGKGRVTAWMGASAIGIGALAFLSEIIASGLFTFIDPVRLLSLALIFTGIVLERISPKPPLQPWMFMLIATKAEFIIVSSLMVSVLDAGHTLMEASVIIWWILVVLMAASTIALLFHSALLHSTVWYASVAVSVTLLLVMVPVISFSSLVTVWAVAATIWPPIAVRLVRNKVVI